MMGKISPLWYRLSRTGLREDEGVMQFREVIFLNKILIVSPLIILFQIPIEIALNGFKALPLDLMFLALMLIPIFLQRFRYFWIAKLYCVIISHTFIVIAGTMVGKGINNHITIIPLLLFGMILFKKGWDRIFVFLISILSYFILNYLQTIISPVYNITEENKQNFTMIFYLLALVVTFLCGFYFLNINKDFEELINKQKESLEEKNKEVKDSITYAKRIQLSILPNENEIKELLPDSFIMYLPKDIVSGDFYWTQQVNNLLFLAAADSTGHGVPGAMVSVICSNALNRSVKEFGITETGRILDKTRELVMETFSKSGSDVKDGMDISLLCLDKNNKKIYWSGANNPLWYVENNKLNEIKADKQPIGKTDKPKAFTTHELDYRQGNSFYLFTDGFADQFGGPKGKKFKYRQLAELMVHKNTQPMAGQLNTLTDAFLNWKGDLEQVDDICIIGLRI